MFKTISQIKQANKIAGGHFFDKETMKFFGSKIESKVLQGRFFITSEKYPDGKIFYSARKANDDGRIATLGQDHTKEGALNIVLSCAK